LRENGFFVLEFTIINGYFGEIMVFGVGFEAVFGVFVLSLAFVMFWRILKAF
jgi:hypothetical protein